VRYLIVFFLVVSFACVSTAGELDRTRPAKANDHVLANPVADDREGGETIAVAVPIPALPWSDTGATCDNIDNYDEACPYTISTSPDVVYSWNATFDGFLFIDLCLSLYDTKVYVYDEAMNLIECNDDAYFGDPPECFTYSSAIEGCPVASGTTYYIVVDGYGGDCGEYWIDVEEFVPPPPCNLTCPDFAQLEGEPPLVDNYTDLWNSGCAHPDGYTAQWIECADFCGVAGWYTYTGLNYRDTDWFDCTAAATVITWTCDAESETNCFELNVPPDCAATVLQSTTVGPCTPGTIIIDTTPGTIVHLWVGSANFSNPGDVPDNEYDYVMHVEGIEEVSAIEQATWSRVRSLYR